MSSSVTRDDLPPPSVNVVDAHLSDHHLLCWQAPLARPRPSYTTASNRPSRPGLVSFEASPLCCPDAWSDLGVDDMVQLYDDELTAVLDQLIPLRTITSRRRQSDRWFDDDCHVAKRCVRLFERDARRVRCQTPDDLAAVNAATEAWYTRRRQYRELLRKKRENFWKTKVDSEHSAPQQLRRSVNTLMGRGDAPVSTAVSPDGAHQFFDDKVANVRASTADAPPPTTDAVSRQRLRSASRHQLIVPRHRRTNFGRRAFTVAGPTAWNSLPDYLRDPSLSEDTFRRLLNIYLFALY